MIITRRFTPQPLTDAQEEARLLHKLALLDDRIADRENFLSTHGGRQFGRSLASSQLLAAFKEREKTLHDLSQIRGAAKEAINQSAEGKAKT